MSPMGPDSMWVQRWLDPELRAYPWKPVPLGALSPVSMAFHTRLQASCGRGLLSLSSEPPEVVQPMVSDKLSVT